jgi:hypothetical protein
MNKVRFTILASIAALIAACASAPATPPKPKGPDLTGNWVLTITSPQGAQDSQMTVQQAGNQISGTISGQQGTVPYTGSVDGNNVAFSFTLDFGGNSLKIDQAGTVEADGSMKGTATFGQFGSGTFVATKKP